MWLASAPFCAIPVSVAAPCMSLLRHYQPRARILYSVADLHHLRLARQSAVQDRPELTRAARRVRQQEMAMMLHADAIITHSSAEAALLTEAGIRMEKLHIVPWTVPAQAKTARHAARQGLIFVGNFMHEPNLDGLDWLAERVMPLVHAKLPEMRLTVAGSGIAADMAKLLTARGVDLRGYVPDLSPLYAESQAGGSAAALRCGGEGQGSGSLGAWVAHRDDEDRRRRAPLPARFGPRHRRRCAILRGHDHRAACDPKTKHRPCGRWPGRAARAVFAKGGDGGTLPRGAAGPAGGNLAACANEKNVIQTYPLA